MAKVHVDLDRCQHYGQCVFEASQVFRLNKQDRLEYEPEVDASELDNIEAAADVCPMQAITLVER